MKVLIDSYNCVYQNPAGGVRTRISSLVKVFKSLKLSYKLYDKWNDCLTDYDIIHIFKANHESFDLIKAAKKKGLKVVVSSIVPLQSSFKFKINLLIADVLKTSQFYIKEILEMSDIIISQTVYEKEYIIKTFKISKAKIKVIPNGIRDDFNTEDKNKFKNEYSLENDYILQVGSIEKNKNQLSVIKAMKKEDIKLVILGGYNINEKEYYNECLKEANENVIFTGWVDKDDPKLLSAFLEAKVVVLPSYKEIFGNSLLEGGAAGANLVSTNVLPIKEWGLEEYVEIINPKDINDINKKIMSAYKKPKDINLKKKIMNDFSWDSVALSHLKIYSDLLKGVN